MSVCTSICSVYVCLLARAVLMPAASDSRPNTGRSGGSTLGKTLNLAALGKLAHSLRAPTGSNVDELNTSESFMELLEIQGKVRTRGLVVFTVVFVFVDVQVTGTVFHPSFVVLSVRTALCMCVPLQASAQAALALLEDDASSRSYVPTLTFWRFICLFPLSPPAVWHQRCMFCTPCLHAHSRTPFRAARAAPHMMTSTTTCTVSTLRTFLSLTTCTISSGGCHGPACQAL